MQVTTTFNVKNIKVKTLKNNKYMKKMGKNKHLYDIKLLQRVKHDRGCLRGFSRNDATSLHFPIQRSFYRSATLFEIERPLCFRSATTCTVRRYGSPAKRLAGSYPR